MVRELSQRAGLPMPRVYIMDEPQPNAFATGRDPEHSAVAVTTGLLEILDRDEVAGVIAHELAHIKNRDTLLMTITATIAGAISMLAQFGMFFGGGNRNNDGFGIIGSLAMVILAPLAAMLVQMAISRTREYAADDMGGRILGRPMALASGLAKISRVAEQSPEPRGGSASRERSHVHRQSAHRRTRLGQPVLHPPERPEPHRRASAARGRIGCRRGDDGAAARRALRRAARGAAVAYAAAARGVS